MSTTTPPGSPSFVAETSYRSAKRLQYRYPPLAINTYSYKHGDPLASTSPGLSTRYVNPEPDFLPSYPFLHLDDWRLNDPTIQSAYLALKDRVYVPDLAHSTGSYAETMRRPVITFAFENDRVRGALLRIRLWHWTGVTAPGGYHLEISGYEGVFIMSLLPWDYGELVSFPNVSF